MLKRWRDGDGVNTPHTEITQTKKRFLRMFAILYGYRITENCPSLPPSISLFLDNYY